MNMPCLRFAILLTLFFFVGCNSSKPSEEFEDIPFEGLVSLDDLRSKAADRREAVAKIIAGDRQRMVSNFLSLAKRLDAKHKHDPAVVAVGVLGRLRATEAIPHLMNNLTFAMGDDHASGLPSVESMRPCVAALIRIGPACLQSVLPALDDTDSARATSAAFVLSGVLGKPIAMEYLAERSRFASNAAHKQRLLELKGNLEKLPKTTFDFPVEKPPRTAGIPRSGGQLHVSQCWVPVIKKLRSNDSSYPRLIETDIVHILHIREWLMAACSVVIGENIGPNSKKDVDEAPRNQIAETSISLLGKLRAEATVPLLAEHLTFRAVQELPQKPTTIKAMYPCVTALIAIGPHTRSLEFLMKKAESTDDESVTRCTAAVLRGVFTKELAAIILKQRLDNQKDGTIKQRLSRVREHIEKAETPE